MGSDTLDGPVLCDADTLAIAARIREAYHPHLAEATLVWVFVPHGPVKNGVVRLGVAKRQSPLNALLTGADFVIILSHDRWQDLEPRQREALLDHELCHCAQKLDKDGQPDGWTIRHHDLEDFAEIVQRHGHVFRAQQEYARKTHRQLELFLAAEHEPTTGGTRP